MKIKKITKALKATKVLINDIKKAFMKWNAKMKKLVIAMIVCLSTTACGVTKASIINKADATQTTITITTSNPITTTTDANPQTDLQL